MTADRAAVIDRSPLAPDVIAIATFLVVAVTVVGFAWQTWPSSDDYCNTITVSHGVMSAMRWLYANWSGRLVTSLVLYAAVTVLAIPELRIVSATVALTFLLVPWQLMRIAQPLDAQISFPMVAFALVALVAGLEPLAGQVVFWPTGGIVYMLPLVLGLHWMQGLRRVTSQDGARKHHVYWFVISLLLGNSIELLAPIMVAYTAAVVRPRWSTLTAGQRRGVIVRAAGLACGIFVLLAAPGNVRRGNATPGSFTFDLPALAVHYGHMWWSIVGVCATLVAIALAVAAVALVLRLLHRDVTAPDDAPSRGAEALALIVGGCASIAFVLAAPAQFAPRNGLYMIVGLFLAALLMMPAHLDRRIRALLAWAMALLAAVVGLDLAQQLATDYELALHRRAAHVARDVYLRAPASAGQDMVVRDIQPPASRLMHAIDVEPDPQAFTNSCVAAYYGLRSVRLGSGGGP